MFAPVAAGPGRHEPTLLIRRAPALAAQRLLAKHAGELSCQLAQRSQVEPVPSGQDSVPAPRRSLAEELRRRTKMITATAMRPLTAISSNP